MTPVPNIPANEIDPLKAVMESQDWTRLDPKLISGPGVDWAKYTFNKLPEAFTKYRTIDPRIFNVKLAESIAKFWVYGPNLIKNYRITTMSGVSSLTAAWWALRGTAAYYAPPVVHASMGSLAQIGVALKVLGAGALGFAAGTALDQAQEAAFGKSYTAAGVKYFLEQPSVWGSAEAAPKQLVDAWDENFAWTNLPTQAISWLKKNFG